MVKPRTRGKFHGRAPLRHADRCLTGSLNPPPTREGLATYESVSISPDPRGGGPFPEPTFALSARSGEWIWAVVSGGRDGRWVRRITRGRNAPASTTGAVGTRCCRGGTMVDDRGFSKRSCRQDCLQRCEPNRNGQPHRKLPPDRNPHCYFPSGFNGPYHFVHPSGRNELAAFKGGRILLLVCGCYKRWLGQGLCQPCGL
jgi:hypothetical protein